MMVRLPIAVLVCLLLLYSCVHGVLIRVRLGDGTLRRVDMDGQEVTSQEKLRSFLQQQGIIDSTSTSKLKVKDSILDITESHESIEEGVFIWKPGEIVEVIEDVATKSENDNISTEASSTTSTKEVSGERSGSTSTMTRMPGTSGIRRGKTKGGMSVADMKKRREDMLKLKTQKVPKNRIVNIVPSAARILNRLGTNGGIAILCGNYVKTGGKEKKSGNTASISSVNTKNKHADTVIQVNVAFEVTTGYESAENNDLVALASNDVKKALTIVDSLGLTVVGCCIGSKPVDEKNALKNPLPKRGIKTIHNSNDDGQKKGK